MDETQVQDEGVAGGEPGGVVEDTERVERGVEYWKGRSREWERRAKANAEAVTLVEGLTEERDSLRTQLGEVQGEIERRDRVEVARGAGLSVELADRLRGETREEWEADAQFLVKATRPFPPRTTPVEHMRSGAMPNPPVPQDPTSLAREWVAGQTTKRRP